MFINGRYSPNSSARSFHGASAHLAAEAIARRRSTPGALRGLPGHAFVALNTANFEDGACIEIPKGAVIEEPIRPRLPRDRRRRRRSFASAQPDRGRRRQPVHHRRNATSAHGADYFTNAVTEIVAGESAVVDHYKVQTESLERVPRRHPAGAARPQTRISRRTPFRSAARWCATTSTPCSPKASEATLNGLYLVNGTQHIDNHTDDRSRQAARHQPRDVQGHSRRQRPPPSSTARSSSARTRRRPTPSRPTRTWCCPTTPSSTPSRSCRFFADDVRCTHGATIGQLDAESLFYLQSRGIGENRRAAC